MLRFWVVITKRLLLFAPLVIILIQPILLRYRGAKIGRLVILGKSKIEGRLSNLNIGEQSSLGRCEITLHDMVNIGRCVVINDGAILLTATHKLGDPQWGLKKNQLM